MRVRWNKQSKEQLRQTSRYICQEFGKKTRDEFMTEVKQTNSLLSENPHLGSIETLLVDLPSKYRSIVVRHLNKIVYRIVDDHIEVVAFWDTRREPTNQASAVKE